MKTTKPKKPTLVRVGSVTVRIYSGESGGYPLHTVVWYEGAKRMRKTFAGISEARAEAERLATRLADGHTKAVGMKSQDADSYGLAMRDLEVTGVPLNVAIREYVTAFKQLGGQSIVEAAKFYAARRPTQSVTVTVHDVVEEFIKIKKADGVGTRYLQDARSRLRKFSATFGTMPMSGLSNELMTEWLQGVAENPRTRKNFRQHVVTLFRWARSKGYLPREAQTEADSLPVSKLKGTDTQVFSSGDIRDLQVGINLCNLHQFSREGQDFGFGCIFALHLME